MDSTLAGGEPCLELGGGLCALPEIANSKKIERVQAIWWDRIVSSKTGRGPACPFLKYDTSSEDQNGKLEEVSSTASFTGY
jgi:hypothetical protein